MSIEIPIKGSIHGNGDDGAECVVFKEVQICSNTIMKSKDFIH